MPVTRRHRLATRLVLALFATSCGQMSPTSPEPLTMEPPGARQGVAVPVTIRGQTFHLDVRISFADKSRSYVKEEFWAKLDDIDLEDVTYVDSHTLTARVPPTLAAGSYDLTVSDSAGRTGMLNNAFVVGDGTPGMDGGAPGDGALNSDATTSARCDNADLDLGMDSFGYAGCVTTPTQMPCPDISTSGTRSSVQDDDHERVPLGFSFDYYGATWTEVLVQSNGALAFSVTNYTLEHTNACLGGNPNLIAAFWDDLVMREDPPEGVFYETRGTAPDRTFHVQWLMEHFPDSASMDVRAVLEEGSGHVTVCYVDTVVGASSDNGSSATAGIAGPAGEVLERSCKQPALISGEVVHYLHP